MWHYVLKGGLMHWIIFSKFNHAVDNFLIFVLLLPVYSLCQFLKDHTHKFALYLMEKPHHGFSFEC